MVFFALGLWDGRIRDYLRREYALAAETWLNTTAVRLIRDDLDRQEQTLVVMSDSALLEQQDPCRIINTGTRREGVRNGGLAVSGEAQDDDHDHDNRKCNVSKRGKRGEHWRHSITPFHARVVGAAHR
jgi:hypothetical protein